MGSLFKELKRYDEALAAFKKAAENAQFQQLMADRGNLIMNISGAEAEVFLAKWQSTTSWLLQDVGAAKISPEKFGIPKP